MSKQSDPLEVRRDRVLKVLRVISDAIPITPSGGYGFVSNPLVNNTIVVMGPQEIVQLTEKNKKEIFDKVLASYATFDSMEKIFCFIQKPYRLMILKYARAFLTVEEFSAILRDAWIATEFPHQNFKNSELIEMFNRADKKILMTKQEYDRFLKLPDVVQVFRGTQSKKARIKGVSWSLSKDKAEFFANRWHSVGLHGGLYQAIILKTYIIAVFEDRGEEEVILDPRFLKDLRIIKGGKT